MTRSRRLKMWFTVSAALCAYSAAWAETRLGLVIGNSAYPDATVKTAVNDAALVAETLRQLGFDVSEGRDLDQTTLRRLVRDFAAKIESTDDSMVVTVYLAGHGAQAGAQNYFLPVDARVARPGDVAAEGLSVDALLRETQNQKIKARFVVLDAATQFPGAAAAKLSPGLAALIGGPEGVVAASASPGEFMPPQTGDYGAYALALTQTLRDPGLQPDEIFNRVKLRVHQETKGAATPAHVSTLTRPFVFLERAPDALPPPVADLRSKPLRDLDPAAAYALVIERDTIKDYRDFLAAFPDDPLAKKVRARMAQKREARAWQLAARKKTREALWSYRKMYPRGAHHEEAAYELASIGAPVAPPPDFVIERWDEFEPPPPDEIAYYEEIAVEPGIYRSIAPPPPPPSFMPMALYDGPPPPPPPSAGPGMLPLIGLGALGAAAIIPRLVKRPPPRASQPIAMPPRPPVAPVVVNPPPVPGLRPPAPNQIVAPPPGATPGIGQPPARPPLPGQIPSNVRVQPAPPAAGAPAPNAVIPPAPGQLQRPGIAPPPVATPGPGGRPAIDARSRRLPPALQTSPAGPPAMGQTGRVPGDRRIVRPPGQPGAVVRELPPQRRVPPPFLQQPVPQPRAMPPQAGPRPFVPPPQPMMRQPPPRQLPPPVAAPVQRPAPPPMAAPVQRSAPPPVARPAPPPQRPAGAKPGCAPNDPRPQCR